MPRGISAILQPLDPVVWTGIWLGAAMAQLFVWGPTPPPQCSVIFSCTKRLKPCVTSGSPNPGALVKTIFILLKAFSCSGPHSKGSISDPAVALSKGLAISEKPSIQTWQNPAAPRNSLISFMVFGRAEQMACFLSFPSTRCLFP